MIGNVGKIKGKEKKSARQIFQWLLNICVFLFLLQWMVQVTVRNASEYETSILWQIFGLFPFLVFGGLYGYFISFIVFLMLFITEMALDLQNAYIMSIYLIGMYIYSMMGQYRWFRLRRRTATGSLLTVILISLIRFLCRDIFGAYNFGDWSANNLLVYNVNSALNVLFASFVLYLFFNKAPDGLKGCFPLGVGYTREYIENLLFQNELRKTRVSQKITAIIIGIVVVLGLFGSTFAQMLLPDLVAMRDERAMLAENAALLEAAPPAEGMPPEAATEIPGEPTAEVSAELVAEVSSELVAEASSETVTEEEETSTGSGLSELGDIGVRDFMRSNYGNAFILKLLLMNLCLGVPLAGIANFYIKMRVGAPIGSLSSYLQNFMDVEDEERSVYAAGLRERQPNTHDEISTLYYATEVMMDDVMGYIERLKEEQKLKEDLRVAQAASEAKSSFLSNMSHEIRTPINAVLGMDEMILRESEDTEIRRYAADIKSAGSTLLSLVNDILDFSKIEAGKMNILPVQYQLGSTINDLVNMLSQKAEEKGLELILRIDEGIPSILYGDEVRIKQCVTNILTNAVKYTEKGSVTLEMGYEEADDTHIRLMVRVVDTGIGIKEEDLGKLFSPFERIEEIRNRTIEGTGLGMSITKKLLAMMDTKMIVKSEYGKGSDFSFEVIQEVVDRTPIGDFEKSYRDAVDSMERYQESFHAPDACVLIVDDTRMNLTVIRSLLKATQLEVDTAESGRETLQKVTERKYDVIFLDHRMPEMDGVETYQAMQTLPGNQNLDTPCIALTANAVSGAREEYLRIGFQDYLSKPVESGKLEKLLLRFLPEEKCIRPGDPGWKKPEPVGETAAREERFAEIQGIDLPLAIKNCGGEDVLEEVLKDFHLSIPEKSEQIERYAAEGDYRNYTVLVHALKSSARLIGAMPLSEQAAYLEQCGNEANAEEIAAKTPALLALYRSYTEQLAAANAAEDDSGKPEIAEEELAGAYADLREFVSVYDYDSAEMILKMLGDYRIPEAQREKHERIRKLLAAVDREGLMELL